MAFAKGTVPARKRAIAWVSCATVGVAVFFAFDAMLKAAPERERAKVRGQSEAISAKLRAPSPAKASPQEAKAAMAEARASLSQFNRLSRLEHDLGASIRAKRFWAALIGLVAGGGCFALCAVSWLKHGQAEARGRPKHESAPPLAAGTPR